MPKRQPDYVAYAVEDREGEERGFWTRIGVGFVNKDESITVKASAWPAGANKLVLQKPKADDACDA